MHHGGFCDCGHDGKRIDPPKIPWLLRILDAILCEDRAAR
jgi:hypothetical protein